MTDDALKEIILALCAAVPATIAAISSVRNGRSNHQSREKYGPMIEKIANGDVKKKLADGNTASNPDWYEAPRLW